MTRDQRRLRLRLLAEFLAVAGGVVFGLFADEWQQSRKEEIREREVLEELLADLSTDAASLLAFADQHHLWDQAALWAYRHRGEDISPDSAANVLFPMGFYGPCSSRTARVRLDYTEAIPGVRFSSDIQIVVEPTGCGRQAYDGSDL